jgi:hypothetical protein
VRLPSANRAIIDVEKLRDYCLSPQHPRGRHKARVFEARLGILRTHAEELRRQILEAVGSAEAIEGAADAFGRRFVVDCRVAGPKGEAHVRTAWIVRAGERSPRLTTCYVL